MPWTETDAVTERHKFILAHQKGLFSMTELCHRFSISRKTGYKWIHRYRDGGIEALHDRSRAPQRCPHRTPKTVQRLLIKTREVHPRWGPRKLLDYLRPRYPKIPFPAASTVGDILKREGLIPARRSQRRPIHPGTSPIKAEAPGQLWTADFKGEFRLGSTRYCYPLTIQDAYSRYLLACHGLPSTAHEGAKPVFEHLFRTYGCPDAIRTDNGSPFASKAIAGLSRLSLWWIKLGIKVVRIEPGHPEQNGRHERMHRTLKAETTRPPERTAAAQQDRFDAFREEFNEIRPHQALAGDVPSSHFAPCGRTMPERVPQPCYPGHAEVRKVSASGTVKFKTRPFFISSVLAGEYVALEEVDHEIWNLLFCEVLLGRFDERSFTLHPGTP